uniref:Eisosome component PIL1-domain-containing protein n=1 Tax=Mycena chlorophos TaxID=658473 RepID=A0ABQ0LTJ8_MYCCL|nr:predicted protein [Mycena chlorophos]
MFKSAATKIAHNSTIPSLGGNKDLRPLQDLITAEKAVLTSLQKLSVDLTKASDALRIWGTGEGEDLGDILGASTAVLSHFAATLTSYASKEHAIRDHLKAIRTREEALDELKRRRKATLARADSAEKKLSKMGAEHKNLAAQTDTLAQLQTQIRQMDGEIMNEEAALGDFKRASARAFMGLKFGGLLETSEKGCIVAEMGIAIASEISEEVTQPGFSRAMYMSHQQVAQRVAETERAVSEVSFSGVLPPAGAVSGARAPPPRVNAPYSEPGNGGISMQNTGVSSFNPQYPNGLDMQNTGISGLPYEPPQLNTSSSFLPPPESGFMEGRTSPGSTLSYQPPQPLSQQPPLSPGFGSSQPGGYSATQYAPPPGPPSGFSAPGGYDYIPPGATIGGTAVGGTGADGMDGAAAPTLPSPPQPEPPRDEPAAGLSSTGVGIGGTGPGGGRFATFPVHKRGLSSTTPTATSPPSTYPEPTPSLGAMTRKDTSGSDFMSSVLDASEFGFIAQYPTEGSSSSAGPAASQTAEMNKISDKRQERDRERQRTMQEDDPVPEYRDYEPEQATQPAQMYSGYAGPPGPPPGAAPPVISGVWIGGGGESVATPRPSNNLTVEEGGGDRKSTATSESEDFSLAYMNNHDDDEGLLPGENEQQREERLSRHVRFGGEGIFGETEPPFVKRKPSGPALRKRVPPPTFEGETDERTLNAAAAREISRELDALKDNYSPPAREPTPEDASWAYATTTTPAAQEPPWSPQYVVPSPGLNREQPPSPQRQYGSSPPREEPPMPNRAYSASPPQQYQSPAMQYQPPPTQYHTPVSEFQPPIPQSPTMQYQSPPVPAPIRTNTSDSNGSHQTTPSWDGRSPTGNLGHNPTPSWARSPHPASPAEGPASPRLEAPYRPFANRSTSSLNSQVGQAPPGARTISAAAFRRPQKAPAVGDVADTSPLAPKKRLPASPYPSQRAPGVGLREPAAQTQPRATSQAGDEGFDYISAYERDSRAFFEDTPTGTPMQGDFGRLGNVQVVNPAPASPTYQRGDDIR